MNTINNTLAACQEDKSIQATMRLITPPVASELLKRNTHNRKISKSVIGKYANEHALGEWLPNAAGIGFDTDGVLVDGQHRLSMIVQTVKPAWLLIVTGLPKASQRTHDRQRRRTLFDALHLDGSADTRKEVEIATCICRANDNFTWNASDMSDSRIIDALKNHKEAIHSVQLLINKNTRGIARAGVMAAIALAFEINKEKAKHFAELLVTGENMTNDTPPMRLRKWLVEGPRTNGTGGGGQIEDFRRTVYALNAWFSGKKIDRLMTADELAVEKGGTK
jgi:hypothetical protein